MGKLDDKLNAAKQAMSAIKNFKSGNIIGAAKDALNLAKNKTVRKKLKLKLILFAVKSLIPILLIVVITSSVFSIFTSVADKMNTLKGNLTKFTTSAWKHITNDYWIDIDSEIECKIGVDEESGEDIIEKETLVTQYMKETEKMGISIKELKLLGEADYSNEEVMNDPKNIKIMQKYLKEFIRADIISQEIHRRNDSLGLYVNDWDVTVNAFNEDEIDGGIYLYRTKNNLKSNEKVQKDLMKFTELETFKKKIENKDEDVVNYFAIDEETGELLYAQINSITTTTGVNGIETAEKEISIEERKCDYKSVVSKYTLPYEFLVNLCMITQSPEFAYRVALLARNTHINLVILDNTTETRDISEETITYTTLVNTGSDSVEGAQREDRTETYTTEIVSVQTNPQIVVENVEDSWIYKGKKTYTKNVSDLQTGPNTTQGNIDTEPTKLNLDGSTVNDSNNNQTTTNTFYNGGTNTRNVQDVTSRVSSERVIHVAAYPGNSNTTPNNSNNSNYPGRSNTNPTPNNNNNNNSNYPGQSNTNPVQSGNNSSEQENNPTIYSYGPYITAHTITTTSYISTCTYDEGVVENEEIKTDDFLGLLRNDTGKPLSVSAIKLGFRDKYVDSGKNVAYLLPTSHKINTDENVAEDSDEIYSNIEEMPLNKLTSGAEMFFGLLRQNTKTADLELVMRYLLQFPTGNDYNVTEEDLFSLYKPGDFSTISSGIYNGSVQEKVWFALKDLGYSEISIAGAMGNIDYESGGFNPSIIEGGSGNGIGLAQWSFGRRKQLENYAASKGVNWRDVDTQVEFLVAEISGKGPASAYASRRTRGWILEEKIMATHDQWSNASTVEETTLMFMRFFESPKSRSSLSQRQQRAQKYYQEFKGREKETQIYNYEIDTTNAIVAWASRQIGNSTFYNKHNGKTEPAKDRCAAFAKSAHYEAGLPYINGNAIDIPHPNTITYKDGKVDCSNIPVGAYIVSRGTGSYGHVALYIGNGMIIEAGGNTIVMQSIDSSYGRGKFLGWGT